MGQMYKFQTGFLFSKLNLKTNKEKGENFN